MSSSSTQEYYRELCELTRRRFGGLHFPELLIRSLDFERIARLQAEDNWLAAGTILNTEAKALERGGADLLPCDKHDALTALHIDCAASASYFLQLVNVGFVPFST